ncbi:MAG: ABC transporter permease, partial [Candidatus Heimdallarchaeota archaeon]|nr:ABC transporter permease [Candidatus Heimdallarchaeota archaeon]
MSLQLELLQTQSKKESVIMLILSLTFAILGIVIFLLSLSLVGHDFKTEDIYQFTVKDTFSNSLNFSRVIYWSMPLILTGLSVAVAFKAGLFNIGGQGQMMVGGGFAAIWGAYIVPESEFWSQFDNPTFMITTTILAGILGGAFWGFIPGVLKAYSGAHEVITTIMMNLTAIALINYWFVSQTYSPYVDKSSTDAYGQSDTIIPNARIPSLNSNPTIRRILDFFNWEITSELNFGLFIVLFTV